MALQGVRKCFHHCLLPHQFNHPLRCHHSHALLNMTDLSVQFIIPHLLPPLSRSYFRRSLLRQLPRRSSQYHAPFSHHIPFATTSTPFSFISHLAYARCSPLLAFMYSFVHIPSRFLSLYIALLSSSTSHPQHLAQSRPSFFLHIRNTQSIPRP